MKGKKEKGHKNYCILESACNSGVSGDMDSIPELERSPGGGNGHPLQYSCSENPMDERAWWATIPRIAKSQSQLSN